MTAIDWLALTVVIQLIAICHLAISRYAEKAAADSWRDACQAERKYADYWADEFRQADQKATYWWRQACQAEAESAAQNLPDNVTPMFTATREASALVAGRSDDE